MIGPTYVVRGEMRRKPCCTRSPGRWMEALITRGSHLPEQGGSCPYYLHLVAKLAPAAIHSTYSRTRTAYVGWTEPGTPERTGQRAYWELAKSELQIRATIESIGRASCFLSAEVCGEIEVGHR
jgi:hypothetical protein